MNAPMPDIQRISSTGTELARYGTSAGERVLTGWRRGRGVEVIDRPVHGRARGYVVDRNMRCPVQLGAFLDDYLKQAAAFDMCPMSTAAIKRVLGDTDAEAFDSLIESLAR
jgi:hypothetical protein